MKYNFDEIIPRRGTNSVKWDETSEEGIIPLWVADMDFRTYPGIIDALKQRVEHGIFGYTHVPDSYYHKIIDWFSQRHGWQGIHQDDIIYTSGVVPAISAIIRGLTLPGDKVLIQTPVYNCFFSSIRNQGCLIEDSPLVRYCINDKTPFEAQVANEGKSYSQTFSYEVDWDRFEAACADPRVRLFLLCNPHNPAGRVWTKDELQRMGEICLKHHVFVIADEIHCELVMPGRKYTPFASISKEFFYNSATCVSPTKGFNIAGLQIANIIVPDEEKRERIDRAINLHEICDVNPFGVIALQEAYTEGGAEWLDQLNAYIHINYQLLCASFPQYSVALLEGTYLAWMDISGSGKLSPQFVDNLFRHQHVLLNGGEMYGDNTGKFVRINLACPRSILEQAIDAMQKVL